MGISKRQIVSSVLGLAVILGGTAAQADDYRLWREQVATDQQGVSLNVETTQVRPQGVADYRLWRNQVGFTVQQYQFVRVSNSRTVGDYLLWREQVKGP